MNDEQLLARLSSIEDRLENIEVSMNTINHELGLLTGETKTSIMPMLIKYVIFPLLLIVGGVVGIKLFIPG